VPGGTILFDVKCSQRLAPAIEAAGGKALMFKTGHSLIKAKMRQAKAELAGEMSGHMFFADRYYGFDDALYAACRLLEIVARSGKPLSAQLEGVPKTISTPELRVDCPDDKKFRVVDKVGEIVRRRHQVVDVDGVRVPFAQGWGLVRASNTQPVLVMRFEAASEKLLKAYRAEMEEIVEQAKKEVGA
jgi:phosphomannomutase / phosphoglucomutase